MHFDLPAKLSIRNYRLELAYSAARLNALAESRDMAADYEEAAAKFEELEQEEGRFELTKVESQAMVETADDAWDDTMRSFMRRLLELSGHNTDHTLYRTYFAEIPSQVTSMSYAAECMISKDLEDALEREENEELKAFAEKLRSKRLPMEAAMRERTRLEVDFAKFGNRVALAKALTNKLRRITAASLDEIAKASEREDDWAFRFFRSDNLFLGAVDADGVDNMPACVCAHGGPCAEGSEDEESCPAEA